MKLRSILKWVATTFGGTIVTPFLQAPATKLAESLHFDTTLSDRWGPLVQWLSDLASNPWYIAFASSVVGFAGGMWVDGLLRVREHKAHTELIDDNAVHPYTETRLRLRRDPNGSKTLLEEGQKNIHAWQQTVVGLNLHGEKPTDVQLGFITDNLFITFSKPISY